MVSTSSTKRQISLIYSKQKVVHSNYLYIAHLCSPMKKTAFKKKERQHVEMHKIQQNQKAWKRRVHGSYVCSLFSFFVSILFLQLMPKQKVLDLLGRGRFDGLGNRFGSASGNPAHGSDHPVFPSKFSSVVVVVVVVYVSDCCSCCRVKP